LALSRGPDLVVGRRAGLPLVFSPDGRYFAHANFYEAHLCDTGGESAKAVVRLKLPGTTVMSVGTSALAFAPDGRTLAWATSWDDKVYLYDRTREASQQEAKLGKVRRVTLGPDTPTLPRNAADGTGVIQGPTALAFSPNGQLLAVGGKAGTVNVWNLTPGEPRLYCTVPGNGWVTLLTFSPDGRRLNIGRGNATFDLVEVATGRVAAEWHWQTALHPAAITRDGRHLVTENADGTAYILRLTR
jgi:WD40 repeat protein